MRPQVPESKLQSATIEVWNKSDLLHPGTMHVAVVDVGLVVAVFQAEVGICAAWSDHASMTYLPFLHSEPASPFT